MALVVSELALGRTSAHRAIAAVFLTLLVGKTLPMLKDMMARMLNVHLSFTRRAEKTFPVGLVENCDGTTTTPDQLVLRICPTSRRSIGADTSSTVTWYGEDFVI